MPVNLYLSIKVRGLHVKKEKNIVLGVRVKNLAQTCIVMRKLTRHDTRAKRTKKITKKNLTVIFMTKTYITAKNKARPHKLLDTRFKFDFSLRQ